MELINEIDALMYSVYPKGALHKMCKKIILCKIVIFTTVLFLTGCNLQSSSMNFGNTNGNLNNGGCLVSNGTYVFVVNPTQEYGITRMNLDGTNPIQVSSSNGYWMNLYKNQLYYIQDTDQCIYRMNLDGTSCTQISPIKASHMLIAYDWIYFLNIEDESSIYRMRPDGTKLMKISEGSAQRMNIVDQRIYYLNPQDRFYIYKMNLDGTNSHCILEQSCRLLVATTDYLFFTPYEELDKGSIKPTGIHRITLTNPQEEITLQNEGGMSGFSVEGDEFYYIDDTQSYAGPIIKSSLDGKNPSIILKGHCALPEIAGNWILLVKTIFYLGYPEDKDHFGDFEGTIVMLFNQESKEWISIEEPLYAN
jgi:hypothetical protein